MSSVLSSSIVDDIEIIVVDNNSSDGSLQMVKDDFPEVKCVQNDQNLGFSEANNRGASIAKGKYLLILNPDTILTETTLAEVLSFSEKQDEFGAAGVHFLDGAGNYLPEGKRNFPTLKVAGAKLMGYSKYYYANHISKNDIAETDILTGAFMFVKREVYQEVKGFDENFFMYGEDIDLSYRISKAGYKNFYLGTTRVIHFKGESTVKDASYLRNFYGALSIFYKKHFPKKKLSYLIIDTLINAIIGIKSLSIPSPKLESPKLSSWVYVGSDIKVFNLLQEKYSVSSFEKTSDVNDINLPCDVVFLDSHDLKFSDIIVVISNPELRSVKKRIISKDHSFLLGSDRSDERGEVVQL